MIFKREKNIAGFTFIEMLVIIGIFAILVLATVTAFRIFQRESELDNKIQELVSILKLAQNRTLASEQASQYGVYFDNNVSPHQYVIFKGANYLGRDASYDQVYKLPETIEIYEINLGGSEIVFNRLTGTTLQPGNVKLRLKNDVSKTQTVYIENSGQVGLITPSGASDDNRLKDSRHIHFDYGRIIDTDTERIILNFGGLAQQEIIISQNLEENQIYWEGEVNVGGETQRIKIHTHRLNSPDTQFSVHRDRRYNNIGLSISVSGDGTGNLIDFSADGLTTISTSIYVSNLVWQ